MDQYIGRLLDNRYEILEIIGTGGMAVVYKARCHRLNRLVAIKILKDEYASDEEFRRRFHAEGEAVAMLSHPNIVQVYDVSSMDNAHFIVMELIDGISLKQYMEKKGVLNWKETLHFSMQIAKGLEHAHSRGIVHRDIKPHNVMVLKNGSVKVMDFGIARVMSKSNTLTKEALGSVHYISPEQAKGGWVDNRSDLYSLSVVMYEMMAGRPPYDGESPVSVAIQHINGGAAMPSTLNPNIPGGMEQIIMKGMSLDAKNRYLSATEMLRDMDEFRKDPGILFHYDKPRISDATQPIPLAGTQNQRTRITADRVAQSRGGSMADSGRIYTVTPNSSSRQRTSSGAPVRRNGYQGRATQNQRRTRQEIAREEQRSRITTMAIVACSAVAVFAIAIFLIALTSGALFNKEQELVTVPNLVGKEWAPIMDGFTIEKSDPGYSDVYSVGEIFHQTPSADTKVEKGTVIYVNVSLGKQPDTVEMDNLIGQKLETALAHLDKQGMNPLPHKEYTDDYEEGVVIRTNPASGTPLEVGQTVDVYYSAGPVIEKAEFPNVVGQNYATAYRVLTQLGFTMVSSEFVESDETKDEVVSQPYKKGEMVDVTTKIVLRISKGPKPTEATTEPTTEATTEATKETEPPETEPEKTEPPTTAPPETTVPPTTTPPTEATEPPVMEATQPKSEE